MCVSHVPEGRHLFSRLTVLENLELGAFPANTRPYLKESLEWAFDLFSVLKDRIHQPAGTLSGGAQRMLTTVRAVMTRPELLMLDEPSLGLPPIIVKLLFKTIQSLRVDGILSYWLGKTFIWHWRLPAMRMCCRLEPSNSDEEIDRAFDF
jgi:branched-chain amino acid transport system ATP-binding protein